MIVAYRRRLPHTYTTTNPIFLTWRLHGSLPPNRPFPNPAPKQAANQAFATLDRLLDAALTGPKYMLQPEIADIVQEAILHNAVELNHYETPHAYAVMPNHVHILLTPKVPLPNLTRSLKGITAKRTNEILNLTGQPFWQSESYDREVRNRDEFFRILQYIENNPVRAGLAKDPTADKWSSAHTRGHPPVDPLSYPSSEKNPASSVRATTRPL